MSLYEVIMLDGYSLCNSCSILLTSSHNLTFIALFTRSLFSLYFDLFLRDLLRLRQLHSAADDHSLWASCSIPCLVSTLIIFTASSSHNPLSLNLNCAIYCDHIKSPLCDPRHNYQKFSATIKVLELYYSRDRAMPFLRRAAPTCVVTTAPSRPTYTSFTRAEPIPQARTASTILPLTSSSSTLPWDTATFPETSNLLPSSANGTWLTTTYHAVKAPHTTALSIHSAVSWPNLRTALTNTVDSASDALQDSLNRAFKGRDLPAIHDRFMRLVPTISLPSMLQVSRFMDVISDCALETIARRTLSEAEFLDVELGGDHFAFARHMGGKARTALVKQRICREWQVMSSRENAKWQRALDEAFMRVFVAEKGAFGVAQLYGMTPVWVADAASKMWRLELDAGLVEIVVKFGSGESEGACEEKRVCLPVDFGLPEDAESMRIADIEHEVVDDGEWLTVKWG
jgi:hypothetical protein